MLDQITSHNKTISTKWVENLAIEELNMEEAQVVNFNDHLDPSWFLEEASIDFLNKVRDLIEVQVSRFNEFRGSSSSNGQIKIFKISNTINDFMLFRNSLRLIFARQSNDLINIGFLTASGELLSPRLAGKTHMEEGPHQIKAFIGPFNDITWKFQGEPFNLESMVRHYLSEFVRHSAR